MTCTEIASPIMDLADGRPKYVGVVPPAGETAVARLRVFSNLTDVPIAQLPPDNDGQNFGITDYEAFYDCPVNVQLTAPIFWQGQPFLAWVIDVPAGSPVSALLPTIFTSNIVTFPLAFCQNAIAYYGSTGCVVPEICSEPGTGDKPDSAPQFARVDLVSIVTDLLPGPGCDQPQDFDAPVAGSAFWNASPQTAVLPWVNQTNIACAYWNGETNYCNGASSIFCGADFECIQAGQDPDSCFCVGQAEPGQCVGEDPCCGNLYYTINRENPNGTFTNVKYWAISGSNPGGQVQVNSFLCEVAGDQVTLTMNLKAQILAANLRTTAGLNTSGFCTGIDTDCGAVGLSAQPQDFISTHTIPGPLSDCEKCRQARLLAGPFTFNENTQDVPCGQHRFILRAWI